VQTNQNCVLKYNNSISLNWPLLLWVSKASVNNDGWKFVRLKNRKLGFAYRRVGLKTI